MFLPAILIPFCASSSPGFCLMYSAYKLNKQGDNIQPYHTPFPIWNQSIVPCLDLTVASWPAYRFLKSQVRVVWYSHLFKNFPQFVVIHTVKDFEEFDVDRFIPKIFFILYIPEINSIWPYILCYSLLASICQYLVSNFHIAIPKWVCTIMFSLV